MDHKVLRAETLITCKRCSVAKSPEDYFPSFLKAGYHVCRQCKTGQQVAARRAKGVRERVYRTPEYWEEWKRQYQKDYKEANRERIAQTARLRRYGITAEEYERKLAEQGGVCATCHQPETRCHSESGVIAALHVDHDHETGEVRGLLCYRCNMALGYAKDNPEILRALATYTEFWAAVTA